MPVDYRGPNINARRLGLYLRQLRETLELSYNAAAAQLGCEVTWLVRLETGFEQVTSDQVRTLLDRYHMPQHKIRTMLVDLASRTAGPPWLAGHLGRMKALVRDLITLESESPIIYTYGIRVMPELVRTKEYARLGFEQDPGKVDADQKWDLLNSRQQHRPGGLRRTLHVIVDQSALTLPPAHADIMRGQLGHLIDLSDSEHATVRVIPMSAGAHAGLNGPFDVLEFPDLNDRVSLVHGALGIDLARGDLTDTWKLLEEVALSPGDSRNMIAQALADLPPQAEPG